MWDKLMDCVLRQDKDRVRNQLHVRHRRRKPSLYRAFVRAVDDSPHKPPIRLQRDLPDGAIFPTIYMVNHASGKLPVVEKFRHTWEQCENSMMENAVAWFELIAGLHETDLDEWQYYVSRVHSGNGDILGLRIRCFPVQ